MACMHDRGRDMEPKQLRLDFPEMDDAQAQPDDLQALIALARKINGNPQMQAAILKALKAVGWKPREAPARMKPVFWIPPKMDGSPAGLIVAPVTPGMVTEQQWVEALGRRVERLVMAERDPVAAVKWASKAVNPHYQTDDPGEAAEILVEHNSALRLQFNLAMDGTFPARCSAEVSDEAIEAAEESWCLEAWVDLAAAQVHD